MGEDNAGVNVVAGDESEDEDEIREEDDDEGWWVGTIGATEVLGWAGETPGDAPCMEQEHDDGKQARRGHEPMSGERSTSEMAEDEWWELESDCLGPEEEGPDACGPRSCSTLQRPRHGQPDREARTGWE
jgi:hypothetical protein